MEGGENKGVRVGWEKGEPMKGPLPSSWDYSIPFAVSPQYSQGRGSSKLNFADADSALYLESGAKWLKNQYFRLIAG